MGTLNDLIFGRPLALRGVVFGGGKGGGSSSAPKTPTAAETASADAATNNLTQFRPSGEKAVEYGYIDGDGSFVGGAPPGSKLPQYAVRSFENDFERGIREAREGTATSLAQQFASDVQNGVIGPVQSYDPSSAASGVAQQIYDRSSVMARDDIERSNQRLMNNLQARGLAPGSEAFNRAIQSANETEQQTYSTLAMDAQLQALGEARNQKQAYEADRAARLLEAQGVIGGGYAPGAVQTPSGGAPINAGQAAWNNYNAQLGAYNAAQNQQASQVAALGQTLGSVGAGVGLLAKSHSRFKEDIRPLSDDMALLWVDRIAAKRWRYGECASDDEEHVGPLAEEWAETTGLGDGEHINLMDELGVAWAAIRALSKKVRRLEAAQAKAQEAA